MNLLTAWFKRTFADPQVVTLGIVLIIGFAIVLGFGRMLAPVFASIVIAYLLEAVVAQLQRFGMPRLIAVVLVFLLFLAGGFFLLFGLVVRAGADVDPAVITVGATNSELHLPGAGTPVTTTGALSNGGFRRTSATIDCQCRC